MTVRNGKPWATLPALAVLAACSTGPNNINGTDANGNGFTASVASPVTWFSRPDHVTITETPYGNSIDNSRAARAAKLAEQEAIAAAAQQYAQEHPNDRFAQTAEAVAMEGFYLGTVKNPDILLSPSDQSFSATGAAYYSTYVERNLFLELQGKKAPKLSFRMPNYFAHLAVLPITQTSLAPPYGTPSGAWPQQQHVAPPAPVMVAAQGPDNAFATNPVVTYAPVETQQLGAPVIYEPVVHRHPAYRTIIASAPAHPVNDAAISVSVPAPSAAEIALLEREMTLPPADNAWFWNTQADTQPSATPEDQAARAPLPAPAQPKTVHTNHQGTPRPTPTPYGQILVAGAAAILAKMVMLTYLRELKTNPHFPSRVTSRVRIGTAFAAASLGATVRTATAWGGKKVVAGLTTFNQHKIEFAYGMASSIGTKTVVKAIVAKFGIAAAVATMPAWASVGMAIGGAIALGATAGAVSGLVKAAYNGRNQPRQAGWMKHALMRGALFGAIGGAFGEGIIGFLGHTEIGQHLSAFAARTGQGLINSVSHSGLIQNAGAVAAQNYDHSRLHYLMTHPTLQGLRNMLPFGSHHGQLGSSPASPAPQTPAPTSHASISAPPAQHPIAQATPAKPVVAPQVVAPKPALPEQSHVTSVVDATQLDVHSLLTTAQMHSLPQSYQKLALSKNPADILRFCGNSSAWLTAHGQAALGSTLREHAIAFAQANNIHSSVVDELNRDEAYAEGYGRWGVTKNLQGAIECAKRAGSLGKPFLAIFKPAPV